MSPLLKLGILFSAGKKGALRLRPSQLFNGIGETGDLARDVGAEKLEGCYGCQGDQSRCYCVL
jgi:hypothetical protein